MCTFSLTGKTKTTSMAGGTWYTGVDRSKNLPIHLVSARIQHRNKDTWTDCFMLQKTETCLIGARSISISALLTHLSHWFTILVETKANSLPSSSRECAGCQKNGQDRHGVMTTECIFPSDWNRWRKHRHMCAADGAPFLSVQGMRMSFCIIKSRRRR